jgi:hypothetical protein
MSRSLRFLAAGFAALPLFAGLTLSSGCGRNDAATLLAPTGIRPAPTSWPGSITGSVFFDPAGAPDLATPPFPPTRLELYLGTALVAVDSLEPNSRNFLFEGLAPATYNMVVRSYVFDSLARGGLPVHEGQLDVGNFALILNKTPSGLSPRIFILGSMPGYDTDGIQNGATWMDQGPDGCWAYPNSLGFYEPTVIAAGTYRLKFVNNENATTNSNLIGWGGSPSDTLTAPVTNHLAVLGSGPTTDLVVRFPVTGIYAFNIDERRQRFSIALIPPAPAVRSRR